jgi:hypothetical protein
MSDENDSGDERVTMPFKFVTGKLPTEPTQPQWVKANM